MAKLLPMKAALITPFLHHLPLHPSSYLGYGTAILNKRFNLDVFDLNAQIYSKNRTRLKETLFKIETQKVVVDRLDLRFLFYHLLNSVEKELKRISWSDYEKIFITTPSWFVTVSTESILNLANQIRNESAHCEIYFFGNSLGTWTDDLKLSAHNIKICNLNDLFKTVHPEEPIKYDALPTPVYKERGKYLFNILPFRLKHGCIWRKCRFCSLAKGWNSGYLERSAMKVIDEMAELIDQYDPDMLVCRDNSINGKNLIEFCTGFAEFEKPWMGMARADLSRKEIRICQRSGCKFLYFGLESGSNRVLRKINKGIDSKQMSRFIRELFDHNILPAPSLFVGAPDETEDDFQRTVQFILDHKNYLNIINLYPLRMTPGSEYTLAKKESNPDTQRRFKKMIRVCEDTGIKVCIGEQSAEYVLFKSVYPGDAE